MPFFIACGTSDNTGHELLGTVLFWALKTSETLSGKAVNKGQYFRGCMEGHTTVSTDILIQTSHQLNLASADEQEIISIFSSAGSWTGSPHIQCSFACTFHSQAKM